MKKGDIIEFGKYPQGADGSVSPIEWLVLDIKKPSLTNRLFYGDKIEALIISRYGLDFKEYNPDHTGITWEDCNLRKWLNNDFIKSAFSEEEVKRIKVSELKNEDNHEYQTRGGNDTKDRVFCLSVDEAKQYFSSDKNRQCKCTDYARTREGCVTIYDFCLWWLRSPGRGYDYASCVWWDGTILLHGGDVYWDNDAVRPALRIVCNL